MDQDRLFNPDDFPFTPVEHAPLTPVEAIDISHMAIWSPRLEREVCFNDNQPWPCKVEQERRAQS